MARLICLCILASFTMALIIEDLPLSQAQTIDELKAGVVKITAMVHGQKKIGTGFIVKIEDGTAYVVTASQLVEGAALIVNFFTNPDKGYKGTTRNLQGGYSKGLAVIMVQGPLPKDIRPLVLASNLEVKGGESATVIGFRRSPPIPWGVFQGILTGKIGADLIVSGAVVNEGNSGGPIFVNKKVAGVLTEVLDEIGYAVPASITQITLKGWGIHGEQGNSQEEVSVSSNNRKIERMKELNVEQTEVLAAEKAIQRLPTDITGKDGAPMVLVAAGVFTMGSPDGEKLANEHPPHAVDLDGFYIDQYEVTVERYRRFLKKTRRGRPKYWEEVDMMQKVEKPVIGVTWDDALSYCEWAGKRLPTEAEWEKAARGMDKRPYPWGASRPNFTTANFGKADKPHQAYKETLKTVGSYKLGKSPNGVYDMAGNVSEWVADWYDEGPSNREWKVVRGGSWKDNTTALRSTYRLRFPRMTQDAFLGFRCAQGVP